MINQATAAHIATLNNEQIQVVATQAAIDSTVISGNVFAHCMRELAIRFDRRSFTNICEAIHTDMMDVAGFTSRYPDMALAA